MEKRTIIAVVLSLAVLLGYQWLFVKPVEKPKAPLKAEQAAPQQPTAAQPLATPAGLAPVSEEKVINVETELYKAGFSTKGGTVKLWELKNYKDDAGKPVRLLDGRGMYRALGLGVKEDFSSLSEAGFSTAGVDLRLDSTKPTGALVFEHAGQGYSMRRTYTFHHDSYRVDLRDEVTGIPEYEVTLGADFGLFDRKGDYAHIGPIVLNDTDRKEVKADKLKAQEVYTGKIRWIALEDKYFFSAIAPTTPSAEARAWKYQDSAAIAVKWKEGVNEAVIYAGPKELDRLKAVGSGLEHVVDFGFFSVIARPIFWLLKQFHKVVGNWGWAIIVLTIVIRVPFIPIVNKGQKSMKRMQELQPRMQEVKEKYKKDPKRLQEEMMGLYKKHKINPMSGCLPMLLQIPVFFALYKVLLVAIELRHAPFALWITDLSAKDPYYVLPIVMGVSMVVQQKMTPSAGDPTQQKIMMFLPVIFTFMFLNFASGLVLYWLVNNVLSIGQQLYVNMKKPAEAA